MKEIQKGGTFFIVRNGMTWAALYMLSAKLFIIVVSVFWGHHINSVGVDLNNVNDECYFSVNSSVN